MIVSSSPDQRSDDAVVVEYQLDGPRVATAVARGQCRLTGVAICGGGNATRLVTDNVATTVRQLGTQPRVYDDAVLARTIEHVFNLTTSRVVDDVSIMRQLLERAGLLNGPDPAAQGDPLARAAMIHQQFRTLPSQLLSANLGVTYAQIEIPIVEAVADMTIHGLGVDREMLQAIESSTDADLEILRRQIDEITGIVLDPDDDNQVASYLFDRCELPVPLLTPRAHERSVSNDALRLLDGAHPVIPLLRRYRDEHALLNAVRTLTPHVEAQTGRVRGHLDPLGAATGRFTSKEANLLGLHGRLRRAIAADTGRVLVEADVSQAEFRVLAHFSRDPTLLEAFAGDGVDLHRQTMALASNKPIETVTKAERQIGKAVNFGIIYGETEIGLARQLGVTESEAGKFIEGFFNARPGVKAWTESVHAHIHQTGFVQTLYGRRRALPAIWSSSLSEVHEAERQAVNTIIQGTAADLMKMAVTRVHHALPEDSRLLLTVHDSVLVEAPAERGEEVAMVLRRAMETSPHGFSVPIKVDTKIGTTWG